ncbi:tyrosine-type recombinase/integrase [Aurantimonas sp. A2-1-M11]|uniref:tyrosine-type recombinase/integrase n=1 Tax=Aurantimonas sp. A2-1-M11 TaxID=3113712 RepID=UPI002F954000
MAFTSSSTGQLLQDWLKWRGKGQYLFCPIYKGKAVDRGLSQTTVKRLIKSGATLADVDPVEISMFSGHSMRVGAAQDLLQAGRDTAAIMRAGGWKSIAVLTRYLESAEHNVWSEL